ncbi:MAG: hypothetical protein PHH36_10835 [Sideroxydans sp.]|nr:hypothetical protein [Sideroxydans sp.]
MNIIPMNHSKPPPLIAALLGGVLLSVPAQAASFECAKAGTKVEHIICDNPEISKLDDELAYAYKTALQDQSKLIGLKQEQKQWLNKRDGCQDKECVKRAYETRLGDLQSIYSSQKGSTARSDYSTIPLNAGGNALLQEWHCEQESIPEQKAICEDARDAKPYRYEIKSILPGKGYSLCELMLENMQAQDEPMSCDLKIAPEYQKYFSLPDWEDVDPWADVDLLWKVDVMSYGYGPVYEARKKLTKEEWLAQVKEESSKANTRRIMRRARFDLDGDGKADWVLAYAIKWNQPCNPWRSPYRQGYTHYILDENGKSVAKPSPMNMGHIFFFSLKEPGFLGAHTYSLTFYDVGKYADHAPRQIEISGILGGGLGYMPACRFDLLKLKTRATDH